MGREATIAVPKYSQTKYVGTLNLCAEIEFELHSRIRAEVGSFSTALSRVNSIYCQSMIISPARIDFSAKPALLLVTLWYFYRCTPRLLAYVTRIITSVDTLHLSTHGTHARREKRWGCGRASSLSARIQLLVPLRSLPVGFTASPGLTAVAIPTARSLAMDSAPFSRHPNARLLNRRTTCASSSWILRSGGRLFY